MPISVRCECGITLNVPDAMAGKTGKCPKCGKPIKVPAAPTPIQAKTVAKNVTGTTAATQKTLPGKTSSVANSSPPAAASKSKQTTAKASSASPSAKLDPTANSPLAQLFNDAGLNKPKDPSCPMCGAVMKPGSAICVSCGLVFETGEKVQGIKTANPEEEKKFDNWQLDRAAKSIKKEENELYELRFVGAPWWVTLAMIFGLISIIALGAIYAEGLGKQENGTSNRAPITTLQGKIQRLPPQFILLLVATNVSVIVLNLASIAIIVKAFQEKMSKGFMALFVPFYLHYYSIVRWGSLRNTARIFWIWHVLAIIFFVMFLAMGMVKRLT